MSIAVVSLLSSQFPPLVQASFSSKDPKNKLISRSCIKREFSEKLIDTGGTGGGGMVAVVMVGVVVMVVMW